MTPSAVTLPPPAVSPGAARAAAAKVLAEPQFHQAGESLTARITAWLGRALARGVALLVGGGRATVVGWCTIAVVVGVAAVLAARFARRVRREPARSIAVTAVASRSAGEWAAEAAGHAAAGRWRDAVRCRYRALVAGLVDAGALDRVPGRTTREHAAQLRDAGTPAPRLAAFVAASDLFEATWYGDLPTGADEYARLDDLAASAGVR